MKAKWRRRAEPNVRIPPEHTLTVRASKSVKGHEARCAPPRLSGRYVIGQETLAGVRGNGREALIAAVEAWKLGDTRTGSRGELAGAAGRICTGGSGVISRANSSMDARGIPQFIPHRVDYDTSDWLSGRDSIPRAAAELQAQQFRAERA
jgi:hypothetical protein